MMEVMKSNTHQEVCKSHSTFREKGKDSLDGKLPGEYIAGFVDGEGCFTIVISRHPTKKLGVDARLHFQIELRSDDMETWELDFLCDRYKTRVFNMHPCLESYKFIQNNPKYREKIFIENFFLESHKKEFTRDCLKKHNIAGICLDFSHLATEKELCDEDYKRTCEIINLYPIGCNHISGFESGF